MKVVHVLADGTVKQDIRGYKVKPESVPEFYSLLKRINKNGGFNND